MKRIALIASSFFLAGVAFGGQESAPSAADNQATLLALINRSSSCATDSLSHKTVCEATLAKPVVSTKDKAGDRVSLKTLLPKNGTEPPITMIEGTIIEMRSRGKNQKSALLRVRIDKALSKDGHAFAIEARIVAIASSSSVESMMEFPLVIAERFPRTPEDDARQPGEMKIAEGQKHASPLDSTSDFPTYNRFVCVKKQKKGTPQDPCLDLLAAKGVYGYPAMELEPARQDFPAESELSSKSGKIALKTGTILVMEIQKRPPDKSGGQ